MALSPLVVLAPLVALPPFAMVAKWLTADHVCDVCGERLDAIFAALPTVAHPLHYGCASARWQHSRVRASQPWPLRAMSAHMPAWQLSHVASVTPRQSALMRREEQRQRRPSVDSARRARNDAANALLTLGVPPAAVTASTTRSTRGARLFTSSIASWNAFISSRNAGCNAS